jgi:hypothetical protein
MVNKELVVKKKPTLAVKKEKLWWRRRWSSRWRCHMTLMTRRASACWR